MFLEDRVSNQGLYSTSPRILIVDVIMTEYLAYGIEALVNVITVLLVLAFIKQSLLNTCV